MVSRKKHTKIWCNPAPFRELHKSEFTRATTPRTSLGRAYHFFDPLSISHHTEKNDTAELVFGPNVLCPKGKVQRAEVAAHRPHADSQAGRPSPPTKIGMKTRPGIESCSIFSRKRGEHLMQHMLPGTTHTRILGKQCVIRPNKPFRPSKDVLIDNSPQQSLQESSCSSWSTYHPDAKY
eukprot:g82638.t1